MMMLSLLMPVLFCFSLFKSTKECINDTEFKQFTGFETFIIKKCEKGKCVSEEPTTEDPCKNDKVSFSIEISFGEEDLQENQLEKRENIKTNTFQCIDNTEFKHFINENGDFVTNKCPEGFCFTRVPPNKNPCIGEELARQLDNNYEGIELQTVSVNCRRSIQEKYDFECIDDIWYKQISKNGDFVINKCSDGFCFTGILSDDFPCISEEIALELSV